MSAGYVYVWEFVVAPEQAGAFEEAYGPEGEWVRLFRGGRGYRWSGRWPMGGSAIVHAN